MKKNYSYELLASGDAFNSNSAFNTVTMCMGLNDSITDFWGFDTGIDKTALSWGEIDWVQRMFNIDGKGGPLVPEWPGEGLVVDPLESVGSPIKLIGTVELEFV